MIFLSKFVALSFVLVAFSNQLAAKPLEFDCKDPKGVHNISFVLDSVIEPIMGLASDISGTVTFDPDQPKNTTGRIVVKSKSLYIKNSRMKKKLRSPEWLDAKKHRTIEFAFESVKEVEKLGDNRWELTVNGTFTCRGVTKQITVPVVITYLPDMLAKRVRGKKGDLLVIRSEFSILRTDYGIKPDMGDLVVAEEIELRVAIVGHHAK